MPKRSHRPENDVRRTTRETGVVTSGDRSALTHAVSAGRAGKTRELRKAIAAALVEIARTLNGASPDLQDTRYESAVPEKLLQTLITRDPTDPKGRILQVLTSWVTE